MVGTAVYEAVDKLILSSRSPMNITRLAFVAIRPPGRHCGEDTPSGFSRSSSSLSLTEGDERITRKKFPGVILRLGKPPDSSV